jgi:hypothetical protein
VAGGGDRVGGDRAGGRARAAGWIAATLLVGGVGLAMLGDRLLELLALQPAGADVDGALGHAQITAGAGLILLVAGAALLVFETARA